jgi:methionine-rich copper-binding protein CopC
MKRTSLVIAGLLLALITFPALAHASLVSASPAPGSTIAASLDTARLHFDEALEEGSTLAIFGENFQALEGIQISLAGQDLLAKLPAPLAAGTYTLQWTAVSDDGHTSQGSYQFGVRVASDPVQPALWLAGLFVGLVLAGGALRAAAKRNGVHAGHRNRREP